MGNTGQGINPQMAQAIMGMMNRTRGQSMLPAIGAAMQAMPKMMNNQPMPVQGPTQSAMGGNIPGMGGRQGITPNYQSPWWATARVNPQTQFQSPSINPISPVKPYDPNNPFGIPPQNPNNPNELPGGI